MIEILKWDTNFFRINVGKITINGNNYGQLSEIEGELIKKEIDLAYYFSDNAFEDESPFNNYSLSLVDKKTTFKKIIDSNIASNPSVTQFEGAYPTEQLINLAISSGVYSRFYVDHRIEKGKFAELYKLWIVRSVTKEIADIVLIYKIDSNIVGFVTVGEKNNRWDIGIIAVDAEYRGRGVGKALMHSAESWAYKKSIYKELQVVTQGSNIPACKLYEGCGFGVGRVEFVYHIWNNKLFD